MKLSQFKFQLPDELIARFPEHDLDESRMMILHRKTGEIEHKQFKDILNYFNEDDVFVLNNSKVMPARLYACKEKTGANITVFLRRELNEQLKLWDVSVDPARKIRIGNKLFFGSDNSIVAEVIDNTTSRGRTLRFLYDDDHEEFKKSIYNLGEAPIPDYLNRPSDESDLENFQCDFAEIPGATTCPASGLHFSRIIRKRMEIKGIKEAFITLHCGQSNFASTDVEDLSKHKMDSEEMFINEECCSIVNKGRVEGRKILAVGTTVQRALETACDTRGQIKPFEGWTNKFIFPPYKFGVANCMLANFYMPESTLLMLVAAFGGYEYTMEAYKEAVKKGYQFGVYGDAMLIMD
ncbi:MAG: tRNA preQ1(34) S-adenosylmethionine ribosyltransferase-isomerase QueA [Prevotellaceae bacterium]|nr:tRNA preQ1(34) S-adenosylmethionine ribosyltransferase-isomerase QueA [Candidatus Faecinaster equi]